MKVVLAVLALVASATALCPNSCSGHGTCGAKDACTCDPNFSGSDCSQRVCPFGLSFVDNPVGDLNHDGSITNTAVKVQAGSKTMNELWQGTASDESHFYSECSGKGSCNRKTGECDCFSGFTGSSCQRATCANDCSGHGRCRTLREIAASTLTSRRSRSEGGTNFFSGFSTASYAYNLWDADKNQACVCDPGYTGSDCSLRECPRGDDPLTSGTRYCGNEACEYAVQRIGFSSSAVDTVMKFGFTGWDGLTNYAYATLDTATVAGSSVANGNVAAPNLDGTGTIAGKILAALRGMPGGALKKVEVRCSTGAGCNAGGAHTYDVTFTGVPGKQSLLTVEALTAGGVSVASGPSFVSNQDGNREEITCSGRGLCDNGTGLCECFAGYYGAACEHQNALMTGAVKTTTTAAA